MVDLDNVFFNISAFVAGLFVLEFGADKFIDHTAKVASRLRVPPTLIALLTAGAEWEELVVVVASISQHQSPLALGNILGSSISNILGAFSLGLIFAPASITFDKSAKIYTSVLLGLTTFFTAFILFFEPLGRIGGGLLVLTFILYFISIAWAIYKGIVEPPEPESDSDSDSDSDSSDDSDSESDTESSIPLKKSPQQLSRANSHNRSHSSSTTTLIHDSTSPPTTDTKPDIEAGSPLLKAPTNSILPTHPENDTLPDDMFDEITLNNVQTMTGAKKGHSTPYHLAHLLLGFLALSLSGYILSHTVSSLATAFSLSSTILGTTLLSLATTLPEKMVSIMSSRRGENSIMIANTAGSNIFLVTLCAGVLFLSGDLASLKGAVTLFEVGSMWVSSLILFGIVMMGGKRWMGYVLFAAYLAFIVLEFTADRR
jgi:Ca2+/Na+ antiporter